MEYHISEESKLLPALCAAQPKLLPVVKTVSNEFTESMYADLPHLEIDTKPILMKHKLVLIQTVDNGITQAGPQVTVATRLYHAESGEYILCGGTLGPTKLHKANETQMLFASATYMRRNQYLAVLNLSGIDDDTDGGDAPDKEEGETRVTETEDTDIAERDSVWKERLETIKSIIKTEVFTDKERSEFRRQMATAKSLEDLNGILQNAQSALRIKKNKTEPKEGPKL